MADILSRGARHVLRHLQVMFWVDDVVVGWRRVKRNVEHLRSMWPRCPALRPTWSSVSATFNVYTPVSLRDTVWLGRASRDSGTPDTAALGKPSDLVRCRYQSLLLRSAPACNSRRFFRQCRILFLLLIAISTNALHSETMNHWYSLSLNSQLAYTMHLKQVLHITSTWFVCVFNIM